MPNARASTIDDSDKVRAALRRASEGKASVGQAREELARLPDSPERAELEQLLSAIESAADAFDARCRRVVWKWGSPG